jgi:glycosyltransferase involved in cell wall biosynthesis
MKLKSITEDDSGIDSKTLPLVSIVTPAYNEEMYLSECIKSVQAQTYSNWDYTIVNNCSTDRTLAIAQEYAARDCRIRVITNNTFVPAIANINSAFRQISPDSKYCKMVLADDWMYPNCLECMVNLMEEHASVGIVGAYGMQERCVLWTGLPYPSTVVSGREICRQRLLGGPYVFGSPTSVLFRSELVRNRDPFYDESNVQSDSEACFELLKNCDFGFVHQILTFSRDHRPGSRLDTSRKLNTAAAGILHELLTHGPFYLAPDEYSSCLEATMSKYYDFLGANLLRRRPSEFWDYHKRKLQEEGIEFRYSRLAYMLGRRVLRRLRFNLDNTQPPRWGL